MAKCYSFIFILSCFYIFSYAQHNSPDVELEIEQPTLTEITFSNQSALLPNTNFSSVLIVGVADMNGDKLDDIIRLEEGRALTIEYQSPANGFINYTYGEVSNLPQWNLAVADVDENGYNDIMVAGIDDGVKLLLANASGTDYTESLLPESVFFSQGSNFVDINNDGLADVFICDDEATNKIWENLGGGSFQPAPDWIDMSTDPPSDNSGNYASSWTDFDNDNDLDLYISKCKMDFQSTDPERINQLFVNDGNGNFTEMAEEYGLKSGAQTWTSDFQDIDNDGDMDCLMINHLEACRLFENDGTGHYTEITQSSGLNILNDPLQGIMRDFDNDGFVDILVAGSDGYLYYENNGNQTFSEVEDIFGNYTMGTFAIGDLNHDGFLDIYSGAEFSNDILWINERNNNNYFAVNLESVSSNRNAIGARLELYGEWGIQIREVRAGESYGIMNSYTQYFGIGNSQQIDSLIIRWPSGNEEVFDNPQANQFLCIVENECAYPDQHINNSGNVVCSGDSLVLEAPAGETYIWSDGFSEQQNAITTGGIYQVTVTNSYGCTSVSLPLEVIQDPDETPGITASGATTFCAGGSVFLFSSMADEYYWSNGQETQSIFVNQSGEYTVTVNGICQDFTSDPVIVEVISYPEDPVGQNDTITEVPGMGILVATGVNLLWYDVPFGGIPLGAGTSFETPEIEVTTSFYVEDVTVSGDVECGSDRVEVLVVVDSSNAVTEPLPDHLFKIYPNPGDGHFIIENLNEIQQTISLKVINSAGQLVFMDLERRLETHIQIDLNDLNSGVYTLLMEKEGTFYFERLVVIKD